MEPAGWPNDGCSSLVGDANLSGQNNNNFTNNSWNMTNNSNNIWDVVSTSCYDDWTNQAAATNVPATSLVHALLLGSNTNSNLPADPHMMCLKPGKRHYCDNTVVPRRCYESSSAAKRCRPPYSSCYVTAVARCQVEGCHVSLDNVKEYYKKHKVCEIHSKAPKVVVLGIQQRFCQQCSRFHGVVEFDKAKRSCRRRLEGHNQRRRKGTNSNSLTWNFPDSQEINPLMEQRLQQPLFISPPQSKQGYALSFLSSSKIEPWISSNDLSSRCTDALYELIIANRASSTVGQFLNH